MVQELAEMLAGHLGLDFATWGIVLIIIIKVGIVATVFLPAISVIAMFSIWWERKVSAHIHSRLGPMHVGYHGILQSIADGIKLILKEDLMPDGADAFLFRLAPYLAFAPVFAAFLALPFGPQFIFEGRLNIGVLYIVAVLSIEVMGVILAGWGSNSKWAIYGAMREACQMVSYEIPLGISIICGLLVAGTLDLVELGYLQGNGIWGWFVFHNPFIFAAFVLYFIASLASNKRAPFDLPESESELVAGFHTEYSGLRFSFFFFAEYAAMFVIGGIQAALFMGGWNSPLGVYDPVYAVIHYSPVLAGQQYFSGAVTAAHGWKATAEVMGVSSVGLVVVNLYGVFWFTIKAFAVIFVQMWLRWTLPRIRIDQVLYTCVKVLLPMSLVTLVGTALWVWLVDSVFVNSDYLAIHPTRMAHLVHSGNTIQFITQIVLTAIGVGILAFCVGVILWAWVHRAKQPMKTFFPDVMPAGSTVAFTPGDCEAGHGLSPKPQAASH